MDASRSNACFIPKPFHIKKTVIPYPLQAFYSQSFHSCHFAKITQGQSFAGFVFATLLI